MDGTFEAHDASEWPGITAGIRRTIQRLLNGECPNLRKSTIEKLDAMGLTVQREHPLHETPVCYPLHSEQFVAKCRELGIAPRRPRVSAPSGRVRPIWRNEPMEPDCKQCNDTGRHKSADCDQCNAANLIRIQAASDQHDAGVRESLREQLEGDRVEPDAIDIDIVKAAVEDLKRNDPEELDCSIAEWAVTPSGLGEVYVYHNGLLVETICPEIEGWTDGGASYARQLEAKLLKQAGDRRWQSVR